MASGFGVWLYTLLLPTFARSGLFPETFLDGGPFGLELLRPQALFGIEADLFLHGVAFSLLVNVACYIGFSLSRAPEPAERLQANIFVPPDILPAPSLCLWRTNVTIGDLKSTVARYLAWSAPSDLSTAMRWNGA